MHIKRIIIKGFKSYLNLLELEEFSPSYNVVVGKNGSGKSNLFAALQFVLSDEYGTLNAEQRQLLLHEGSGKEVMSAYVEIVFDNTDGRFPIDSTEVSIRRAVGAKKDEYYLHQKHATKQEIVNFLESAGFSRSNPYHMVQQGRIQELATMSDEARLELLKEVAGTRVYEERRAESSRILEDAAAKKAQVEEMLQTLGARLEELEKERTELLAFQRLDTSRRSLQYAIYEKDRERATARLAGVEEARALAAAEVENADARGGTSEELRQAEKQVKALQAVLTQLTEERDRLRESQSAMHKEAAQVRLDLEDVSSRANADKKHEAVRDRELDDCEARMRECEQKLRETEERLDRAAREEEMTMVSLREKQTRLDELLQREARAAQFKSKKERDTWLKGQIKSLDTVIAQQREKIENAEAEIADLTGRLAQLAGQAKASQKDFGARRKAIQDHTARYAAAQDKRDDVANRRKELWRQDEELRQSKIQMDHDLAKAEKALQATVSRDIAAGVASVRKIVEDNRIGGVHGPLIELFTVRNEALLLAVDVTGGSSLFHIVVDNDDVAALILSKMNAAKAPGRVSFLPLNRLNGNMPRYPEAHGVWNIVDQGIVFDPALRPAMAHVFGRTLVCSTLEQAMNFSTSHNLDCITLDGDRVDRKGALTGGFSDRKSLRLRLQADLKRLNDAVERSFNEQDRIRRALQDLEEEMSQHVTAMRKAEEDKEKECVLLETLAQDIKSHVRTEQTVRASLESAQQRFTALSNAMADLTARRESLNRELTSPFTPELNDAEREELTALSRQLQDLRATAVAQSGSRGALEAERTALREDMSGNLARRRAELITDHRVVFEVEQASAEMKQKKRNLTAAEKQLKDSEDRVEALEARMEEVNAELRDAQNNVETLIGKGGHVQQEAVAARRRLEELLNERALYLRELEGAKRKIREVGTISTEEFNEYKEMDVQALYAKLQKIQEKLQGYSHVNKKAGEQFVSFLEQRDKLLERNTKLDEGHESIVELIRVLDDRKDEAIVRTFKGVAKHFTEVFKELVPDGEASMTIVKTNTGKRKAGAEEADPSSIESFVGVRVRAAFSERGVTGAPQDLAQLSGGQKSLVALALIFAVQRADPAPFYLLDEVDAALDSTHRAAVARLLKKQSETAQYLVATFKPELVFGDHFYRISYANKVSNIQSVSQQDALAVLQENAR